MSQSIVKMLKERCQ